MDEEGEEAAASRPNVTIPEDLDSREAMVSCALLPLPQSLPLCPSRCPDTLVYPLPFLPTPTRPLEPGVGHMPT